VWRPQEAKLEGNPIRRNIGSAPVFSPDGRLVVSFSDKFAQVLQIDYTSKPVGPVGPEIPRKGLYERVAFSYDSQHLIVASDKIAQVYEVGTGKPQGQPLNHKDTIHSLALDSTGHVAVTGSWREAQLWVVSTGKPIGASRSAANRHLGELRSPQPRRTPAPGLFWISREDIRGRV